MASASPASGALFDVIVPPPAPIVVSAIRVANPGTPVALTNMGDNPLTLTRRMLRPWVGPRVQPPRVATPFAFVVAVPPVMVPPPESTVKVTVAPATGLPAAFLTMTAGVTGTAAPGAACWPFPAITVTDAGVDAGGGEPVVGLELHAASRTRMAIPGTRDISILRTRRLTPSRATNPEPGAHGAGMHRAGSGRPPAVPADRRLYPVLDGNACRTYT